jgi:hypothetical protein
MSLGDGLPSLEGERECLVPLLSSIVGYREQERRTLKASGKEKRITRWLSAQDDGDIYSQRSIARLQ